MGNVSEAYNDMMQGDAGPNWVVPSIKVDKRMEGKFYPNSIYLIAGEGISYTSGVMNMFEETSK